MFLDPDGDLTPFDWTGAFTDIDDAIRDPTVPGADDIDDPTTSDAAVVSLGNGPGDYGSNTAVRAVAYIKPSTDRGADVELRKADETVLSTASVAAGGSTAWYNGSDFTGALTAGEIDGLKMRHIVTA